MAQKNYKLEAELLKHPEKTNKEIADACDCEPDTVAKRRRKMKTKAPPRGRPQEVKTTSEPLPGDVVKYYGPSTKSETLDEKIIQPSWLCIDKKPNLRRMFLYE